MGTFSVSSFLTCLRLARRSMQTLCLEPSRARSMASADMRTRRRGGLLNLPLRSNSFWLKSSSCGEEKKGQRQPSVSFMHQQEALGRRKDEPEALLRQLLDGPGGCSPPW